MKNVFYIILLLIVFFACNKTNTFNQTTSSSEDSLAIYLSKANDFSSSQKKRQEYIQKSFTIIISLPNDSINRVNLFRVANRYYNINNWKAYKETVQLVLEKSVESNDILSTAKAYSYLGDYYDSQGIADSAFLCYFKSEKLYLNLNEKYNTAKTRLNIASLQYNESDYLGSEMSVFKALRTIKDVKANDILYESYNLLGIVYNELAQYDKAIEYQNKALAIDAKTIPVEFQAKATSLNNLGLVYQNLNKNKKAISYFQIGLEQNKDLLLYKPSVYAMLLDNLGIPDLN